MNLFETLWPSAVTIAFSLGVAASVAGVAMDNALNRPTEAEPHPDLVDA